MSRLCSSPCTCRGNRSSENDRGTAMSSDILAHETVTQVKQAVASEDFDSIQTALAGYRRHVEAVLANWPPDAPLPVELAQQAEALMQWALQAGRCSPAPTPHDLGQVAPPPRYHPPPPPITSLKANPLHPLS